MNQLLTEIKFLFLWSSLVCPSNVLLSINPSINLSLVLDKNDNTPIFDESTYIFEVEENTDFVSFRVSASDNDIGANGEITYAIVDGNIERTFLIGKWPS